MRWRVLAWPLGVAFILISWWVTALWVGPSVLFPRPSQVFRLLTESLGTFLSNGAQTASLAGVGLIAASLVATVLVCIVGLLPRLETLIYPFIVMLKASPAVAFAPLLVVLFHSGPQVKMTIAALISFFPMAVGGIDGVKRCPRRLKQLASTYGAGRWPTFSTILSGYAFSGFLSGMKTAAPLSVVGAIVGEFVDSTESGRYGIGIYIASHARGLYMDHVFAGVIVATAIGVMFFAMVHIISNLFEGALHLGQ